jgi:hypothetical protein
MRAARFVDDLGTAASVAAKNVAEAAEVTASHQGGLSGTATTSDRVGAELLRQLTRETDGMGHERLGFEAEDHRFEPGGSGPGFDIALSVDVDLPAYRARNRALGTVLHATEVPTGGGGQVADALRDEIETLIERSPATYLFVVGSEAIRVLPGRGLAGLTIPLTDAAIETHVYGRSLRRFVEALAEGFLGVRGFDDQSDGDGELAACGRAADLDGVFRLQISGSAARTESSLSTFLERD